MLFPMFQCTVPINTDGNGLVYISIVSSFPEKYHRKTAHRIIDVLPGPTIHALIADDFTAVVYVSKQKIVVPGNSSPLYMIYSKRDEFCSYSSPTANYLQKAAGLVCPQSHYKPKVDHLEQVRKH